MTTKSRPAREQKVADTAQAEMTPENGRAPVRIFLVLHGAVFLYAINTVCAKAASSREPLSLPFFGFLALEVLLLFVYALIWQQVIKRIDLSVAYANKAVGLLWSLLWGVLLFHEALTPGRLASVALIIAGTLLMNTERTKP